MQGKSFSEAFGLFTDAVVSHPHLIASKSTTLSGYHHIDRSFQRSLCFLPLPPKCMIPSSHHFLVPLRSLFLHVRLSRLRILSHYLVVSFYRSDIPPSVPATLLLASLHMTIRALLAQAESYVTLG